MDTAKRERLEQAGFQVGTVADFLGLTPEEEELVESKAASSAADRTRDEITQDELAEVIASRYSH